MNKAILIICDGLSDRPIDELGGKTPLEAALKPNLDELSRRGVNGLMHTIDIGIRPGSDVAHLSIFGYDPYTYYTGRGPFEVAGIGMDFKEKDIAFRGNFATVDPALTITDRRAGRIDNTQDLIEELTKIKIEGGRFIFKKGVAHRVGVILRGDDLSAKISDNDPHITYEKVQKVYPLDNKPSSKKTAKIVNRFLEKAYQVLAAHPLNKKRVQMGLLPANYLLLRGAGQVPNLIPFSQKYGLTSACIAGAGLYKGVGKMLGMKVINVSGTTGKEDSDISAKIKAAIKALNDHDFVFVHIKAADTLAEDGNFLGKKEFIEKIDKALAPTLKLTDTFIIVTADHTTASTLKMHTSDPVPIVIAGRGVRTDHVSSFGERAVAGGKLGFIRGEHLMKIILDLMGKAPLFGA